MTHRTTSLTAREAEQIKARCPALKEPWTITPTLIKALEQKRAADHRHTPSADQLYRNARADR